MGYQTWPTSIKNIISIAKLILSITIHKTQGITLPRVSLALDSSIFSAGQAYVALGRCPKWEHVQIMSLHKDAFKTDPKVINEYQRLEQIRKQSTSFHPLTY